jgi:drug/metabolite transporter (DMT)-like permease
MKKGMLVVGEVSAGAIWGKLLGIFSVPWILLGFVSFGFSAVLWLCVLSRSALSYAYPMVATSYVLILVASSVLFREAITPLRVVGVAFICLGVVLVARS